MMDDVSKKLFDEILNKDLNDLTFDNKAFLFARRSYLRPEQIPTYEKILEEQLFLSEEKLRKEGTLKEIEKPKVEEVKTQPKK